MVASVRFWAGVVQTFHKADRRPYTGLHVFMLPEAGQLERK